MWGCRTAVSAALGVDTLAEGIAASGWVTDSRAGATAHCWATVTEGLRPPFLLLLRVVCFCLLDRDLPDI